MKRILDSVHGYIFIGKDYCREVIDTPYFQRLRRIEQTSGRALFPCARHDRFMHSLGVFHLGQQIINSLVERNEIEHFPDNYEQVFESYLMACLLHDVGHSPFSHTFEDFFDNPMMDLKQVLKDLLKDDEFSKDWEEQFDNSASHEIMSAIVACNKFKSFIDQKNADAILVARMIVGCKYKKDDAKSFENAFIDLIHGVIDADGLDYVCRDAWASGYSTNNVDVKRLIDSICIQKDDKDGKYKLCFTSKALNEIESVLNVKNFQQYNVITHHTIKYEQQLLIKAMESAALYHLGEDHTEKDSLKRKEALQQLCNLFAITDDYTFGKNNIVLSNIMDDDFVALMKYVKEDYYIKQWFSRQYQMKSLWKSKAEFFTHFDFLRDKVLLDTSWIFSDSCKEFISKEFGIPLDKIWILKASPKYKGAFGNKIYLSVNGKIQLYSKLFPQDIKSITPKQQCFCYVYVPKECDREAILNRLKEKCSLFYFNGF